VRQTSHLEPAEDDGINSDGPPSPKVKQQHRLARGVVRQDGYCEVAVHIPGREGKGAHRSPTGKGKFEAGSECEDDAFLGPEKSVQSFDRRSEGAGSEGGASFVGSMADGMSEAGGSGIEPSSVTTGAMGHEEDLAVDMRCAAAGRGQAPGAGGDIRLHIVNHQRRHGSRCGSTVVATKGLLQHLP
jgi:hypothetical protein